MVAVAAALLRTLKRGRRSASQARSVDLAASLKSTFYVFISLAKTNFRLFKS